MNNINGNFLAYLFVYDSVLFFNVFHFSLSGCCFLFASWGVLEWKDVQYSIIIIIRIRIIIVRIMIINQLNLCVCVFVCKCICVCVCKSIHFMRDSNTKSIVRRSFILLRFFLNFLIFNVFVITANRHTNTIFLAHFIFGSHHPSKPNNNSSNDKFVCSILE